MLLVMFALRDKQMTSKNKPVIMTCGCWQCSQCLGYGIGKLEPMSDTPVMCDGCAAGKVKLCRAHASEAGWIKEGRNG
jgi:hypothetical protein